jgi:hypothetical protein
VARLLELLAVGVVQLAVFAPIAIWRYVDGDEGSYLAAAALVGDGRLPYRDFLYPQTPLFPYVYGAWAFVTGESWYAARLLSAVFAAATGVLVFHHLRHSRDVVLATVGAALFSSSVLVKMWHNLPPVPNWEHAAGLGGYRLVATIATARHTEVGGPVRIFERPG